MGLIVALRRRLVASVVGTGPYRQLRPVRSPITGRRRLLLLLLLLLPLLLPLPLLPRPLEDARVDLCNLHPV